MCAFGSTCASTVTQPPFQTSGSDWLFLPSIQKSHQCTAVVEESSVPGARRKTEAEPDAQQLKTKRLKEYTVQSHASVPPNHTYADVERFARALDDIALMETGVAGVRERREALQGDMEALLSAYGQREAWLRESGEVVRQELSRARYELRKAEATRSGLRQDLLATDSNLRSVGQRYLERQTHLSTLREELTSELCWMREVVVLSLHGDAAGNHVPFGSDVNKALRELLSHICGAETGPDLTETD